MAVNRDKPDLWKDDIACSVDMYNEWFIRFAPEAFRSTRMQTTQKVEDTLKATQNLTDISPALLKAKPEVLSTLRMSTCPPLAVDRLIGLAGVVRNLVCGYFDSGYLGYEAAERIDWVWEHHIDNLVEFGL